MRVHTHTCTLTLKQICQNKIILQITDQILKALSSTHKLYPFFILILDLIYNGALL
jgi:hypothetical protein